MNHNKLWLIGSALVTSVIVVLGVLLGIQPQLETMNAANASRAAVQATNTGHVALLARLKHDFANLDALTTTADALAESVPSGSMMPALVDQLDAEALAAGLTLTGMTVTEAVAYAPILPAAAAVPADGAAVPADPAVVPAVVPAAVVTTTAVNATNFAAFPLQVTVTGSYDEVLDFVARLQSGSRLFLVSGLDTVAAPALPGLVNATVSGLVYSLVAPAAASAG
ncbi:hypothetical protein [Cryobacterium luteum]|uniref:Tfp pilus assembly protein PilO n=1 Tax=Cryobacterium luteum TaxID=1424661 RepID=A0A1H8C1T5_9MICO|nr:hypothetical protein [Cryobacterium luteum]TFB89216.1 hypothetical protein E3O10_10070 [Cryobacterium luteum]SEM89030.1 hypothetical protein SAMN05216281_102206 [Cryobacterium luteum]